MYDKKTVAGVKIIVFYYTKTQLFGNVKIYTNYRARTLLNEKGESQVDVYAISDAEIDAFELFMAQAIADLFQIALKMSNGVDDAVISDGTYTDSSSVVHTNVYGIVINNEEAFNENNLFTADQGIKDYLHASVMADWYSLVGLEKLQIEWLAKKTDIRRDMITNRFFQLRKTKLS